MDEATLSKMTRDELIAEIRRLQWVDEVSGEHMRRFEAVETDNARLREGQTELAEVGARYLDLYEAAPVPYCVLDDNGTIVELNHEAASLLGGREGKDLRGKSIVRFIATKERRGFLDHLKGCLTERGTRTTNITLQANGGQMLAVQMVTRPVIRDGHVAGCRAAFFDVSDQKRGEDDLRLAVRMREDFLAVVAHDLRNPLASIVMSAELLARQEALANSRELATIGRAAKRMNRLVSDLLDLSSMQAGHLSVQPAMQDMQSLIVSALEIAGPMAAEKRLGLSAYADRDALFAWCDRERVIQALLNLISNSIKFTTTGSISVRARASGDEIVVVVHDTGKGMARAQLEHVFDPYWQASPGGRQGTGLGLSIVKGIVQLHGGRVWVESTPGRGSSFSFTLPARPLDASSHLSFAAPSAPLPPPESRSVVTSQGHHTSAPLVLLIDDENEVRESIGEVLRAEGYDVVALPNGRAALDWLERARTMPALILLDLVMPVMDGWEFLRQQSRAPLLAKVPVVLVSGQADVHAARDLGLAGHIAKPVRLASLCDVVGTWTAPAHGA